MAENDEPALPPHLTRPVDVVRLPGDERSDDRVAVEEPLEIRIGGEPVAVTMRTPGHDEELALGFCITEALAPAAARVPDDLAANTVDVEASGFDPETLRHKQRTVSEISAELQLPQSNVSQHLGILRQREIVRTRRIGSASSTRSQTRRSSRRSTSCVRS